MLPSALDRDDSNVASIRPDRARFPLIAEEELWDRYHLESLLPLKETYRENAEFGFLLRHYWIPATTLTFCQSSQKTFPDGHAERSDLQIERKMARCRSNECLWREKTYAVVGANGNEERSVLSEMLCSYDCYEQTFHFDKPISFSPPTIEQKTEARRQALYRLPMLCPPGPVPIGFTWYAKVGDDYMNYCLETEEQVGQTSVLVIRRVGRYTTYLSNDSEGNGERNTVALVQRQGVALFAWNRGTVLEDRFFDRVVDAKGRLPCVVGTANQVVTRLFRSCPEHSA